MAASIRATRLSIVTTLATALLFTAAIPRAFAQVKPGDFITPENAVKVKNLLSPGEYWRVANGMSMKIVPTRRIDWPPPYREATEKYSSQVRLGSNRKSLVGYVAGQPFPLLDPNDPEAGVKIMWNVMFRPMWTDDLDARYFGCSTVREGLGLQRAEIDYTEVGHYMVYNEVGRTEVEPLPVDPDFLHTGIMFRLGLYPVIAPASSRGLGIVRYRYADPLKGDDSWDWTPQTRRVRRLNESILTGPTGVVKFYPDDYEGYNPKIENYSFRFLGEKAMLGAMHVSVVPGNICPTDGGGSVCPAEWELRRVYIVEVYPDRSRISEELASKHIVYIDSEADVVLSHDQYDRRGELYINFTNWLTYRDRPVPDARVAIYPFNRVFQVNGTSTDVQSGLSSFCDLPSPEAPERECWYINMGAVDRYMCSVTGMVERGGEAGR